MQRLPRTRLAALGCAGLLLAGAGTLACASAPKSAPGGRTVLMSDDGSAPASGGTAARRGQPPLATVYDDASAGREGAKEVEAELGLYGDAELDAYVGRIGERLLRGVPRHGFRYRFSVVDQVEPNAFALPGGYVFVSRGLLALTNSEDELANVIGHEITHAAARHAAARQAAAQAMSPLAMGWIRSANMAAYSRDMERDADRGGQQLAAAAGYDPMGMSTFLARLGQADRLETGPRGPSFFDTHPGSVERASVNAVRASELRWRRDPALGDTVASHLRRLEGLAIGPRPQGGVFVGSVFVHPDLGFQMRFPDGWRLQNGNRAVGALSPHRDALVLLAGDLPPGDVQRAAEAFVAKSLGGRARVKDARPVKLGTLDAWRMEIEAPGGGGTVFALATFFPYRGGNWHITGATPAMLASRYTGQILAATRSFRPLTPELRAQVRQVSLHVVTANGGEDLAALSRRTANVWNPTRTAVMNGLDPTHRFAGGELVKVARAG
jgi:predicted Zn-dependent protease